VAANANAAVETKFIFPFNYEYKTQEIDAFGAGTSFCKWMMYKKSDLRNDISFYPVIRTLKSVKQFDCVVKAYFKIGKNWERSELFEKEPKIITVNV
jgi:hypothetical protein